MPAKIHPNRLSNETSPYLLQHAHNPVDWYPWGEEALARARVENKPILLSIGYSACHWCHVMAHESFEDEATAQVMNEFFVNIKVDREERPDLDKIYQTAYQLLNGRGGGWPLTMFLTPDDQAPFLGGTYFPKEPRYGMPAFKDLLDGISSYYRDHEDEVHRQNISLLQALQAGPSNQARTGSMLDPTPLQEARDQLVASFDPVHGGFGAAPKFPHPTNIERLLRQWASNCRRRSSPDREAGTAALVTLRKMALGGIYDHLGGGFYRYSVDAQWMIPHFEKMLYDNGSLLSLYSEAWQATGEPLFKRVVEETGAWVIREMQAPEGGYYSSLDADSEGRGGEILLLDADGESGICWTLRNTRFAQPISAWTARPISKSHWHHLYIAEDLETVARRTGIEPDRARQLLQSARHKLYLARSQRIRPGAGRKDPHRLEWLDDQRHGQRRTVSATR